MLGDDLYTWLAAAKPRCCHQFKNLWALQNVEYSQSVVLWASTSGQPAAGEEPVASAISFCYSKWELIEQNDEPEAFFFFPIFCSLYRKKVTASLQKIL